MPRPNPQDAAEFYHNYISYAKGNSPAEVMTGFTTAIKDFYNNLPEAKAGYAYAPGKWTIKDLIQHLIDAERIFAYRALRIARKDTTPLPGFDENNYAVNSNANSRTLQSLKEEFNAVRTSTNLMLQSFTEDQLNATGTASNNSITVNAIAFIIFGHLLHHKKIIEERYLS
ncbi:MAG TPA: DinB family protein [Panacibacter sp.]|nr:DinB family protein [Panacibacter sp.]